MTGTIKGQYAVYDECTPTDVSWRFRPKRSGQSITMDEIERELHNTGMSGNLYATIMKIGDEFPDRNLPCIDLYEPDTACKILAQWCGFTVFNHKGEQIV